MKEYIYNDIRTEKSEIRLLSPSPRTCGPLHIVIWHAKLDEKSEKRPIYDALSYAWGSNVKDHVIEVRTRMWDRRPSRPDGCSSDLAEPRYLRITESLAVALPYLQWDTFYRHIWIDAMCINQQDYTERGHQINRMANIYSLAENVLVWLGPASEDSGVAMRFFETHGELIDPDWGNETHQRSTESHATAVFEARPILGDWIDGIVPGSKDLDYWDEEQIAIHALYDRSWFERLWVWQEIVLGSERAILICGDDQIWWRDFAKAVLLLQQKDLHMGNPTYVEWDRRRSLVYDLCRSSMAHPPPILTILLNSQIKSTNPLDRLYGALTFLSESDRSLMIGLEPDYSMSPNELFKRVVVAQLHQRSLCDILEYCGSEDPTWGPTWVPNLTNGVPHELVLPFYTNYADAQSVIPRVCVEGSMLIVNGMECARVISVHSFGLEEVSERAPLVEPYDQWVTLSRFL